MKKIAAILSPLTGQDMLSPDGSSFAVPWRSHQWFVPSKQPQARRPQDYQPEQDHQLESVLPRRPQIPGSGTTPVPNVLLDTVLPTLSDTELRVLLVVVRSTLGWRAEQGARGARKERDWLSHRQVQMRTGRAGASVSKAIDGLVKRGLLRVQDERGQELPLSTQRRAARSRLYYQFLLPTASDVTAPNSLNLNVPSDHEESNTRLIDSEFINAKATVTNATSTKMDEPLVNHWASQQVQGSPPFLPTPFSQLSSSQLLFSQLSTPPFGIHKAKTTKENETKESNTKVINKNQRNTSEDGTEVRRGSGVSGSDDGLSEIRIELPSSQSEVVEVGSDSLRRLKPSPPFPPEKTCLRADKQAVWCGEAERSAEADNQDRGTKPTLPQQVTENIDSGLPDGERLNTWKMVERAGNRAVSNYPSPVNLQPIEQACHRFMEHFEAAYRRARPETEMPTTEDAELQKLKQYLVKGEKAEAMLNRWLPAFFASNFGYVRRRNWSLGAYLESVFVLQARAQHTNAQQSAHARHACTQELKA